MKRKLLVIVMLCCITNLLIAQTIEIIGKGINGVTTSNLLFTDLNNIDHIDVGVINSHGPNMSASDVTFSNFNGSATTTLHPGTDIINFSILDNVPGEFLTASFNEVDASGIDLSIIDDGNNFKDFIQSYYAFVYRNAPNSSFKSFSSLQTVYFWLNTASTPYIYNIPINAASGSRDITVKIPVSELEDDSRPMIIDITAGLQTVHDEVITYNLGDSFFLGEYTITDVPGNVTNVTVSIYSPPLIPGVSEGDSFYVNGVVVDVDIVEEDCGECEGKVTSLEMQYNGNGTDGADIEVLGKKEGNVIFAGYVEAGGTFNLEGFDKKGTLGTEIILNVGGVQNTKIHTSCSKPIGPGLISGAFEVLGGVSREGGILCPVDDVPPPPSGGDCEECEGQITSLDLEYLGDVSNATIKVYEGKVQPDKLFATFTNKNMGDILSFVGSKKQNKMGAKIKLTVNDGASTEIHTSCSQDIYAGMTVENTYLITAGTSHEGGALCDMPQAPKSHSNINIFPNPVADYVTITLDANLKGSTIIELYNTIGQRVDVLYDSKISRVKKSNKLEFNTSKYRAGRYFVIIKNGDKVHKKQIVIK